MQNIVSSWARNDPQGAGQWLATLPADKSRERAAQSYVSQLSYEYPEMAAPWVNAISDPNQRNFAIENVARQWLQADSKAAATWLA